MRNQLLSDSETMFQQKMRNECQFTSLLEPEESKKRNQSEIPNRNNVLSINQAFFNKTKNEEKLKQLKAKMALLNFTIEQKTQEAIRNLKISKNTNKIIMLVLGIIVLSIIIFIIVHFKKKTFKISDALQLDEDLENIKDDDDSYKDDLDAKDNELGSEKKSEKSNEDSDSKMVQKSISPIVNEDLTHSTNLDSNEERDEERYVENGNESLDSKSEVTNGESQGLHSINWKKVLMIAGVVLVGIFFSAIFVAIYRYRKNQLRDKIFKDKIKFESSFQNQVVIVSNDNENYDLQ